MMRKVSCAIDLPPRPDRVPGAVGSLGQDRGAPQVLAQPLNVPTRCSVVFVDRSVSGSLASG